MPGFQLSGLASGMDTKTIIEQLIGLEQQPIVKMQREEAILKQKNDAFQTIGKRLKDFQTKARELTKDTVLKGMRASSTDASRAAWPPARS